MSPGSGELRVLALQRLTRCLENTSNELCLNNLRLTTLPENLPPSVKHLNVDDNNLFTLPHEILARLQTLTAANNPGLALNDLLSAQLPSPKSLHADIVGFTKHTGYDGIKVIYDANKHGPDPSYLKDRLYLKQPQIGKVHLFSGPWDKIAGEQNSVFFNKFLGMLGECVSPNIGISVQAVKEWLNHLARDDHGDLRRRTFALAKKHAPQNGPAALAVYWQMRVLALADDVAKAVASGHYDTRKDQFFILAKGYFYLTILREKIFETPRLLDVTLPEKKRQSLQTDALIDYRAYQTHLNNRLFLPSEPLDKPFPHTKRVTPAKVERLYWEIIQSEHNGLKDFLIQDFPPWLEALKRWEPKKHQVAATPIQPPALFAGSITRQRATAIAKLDASTNTAQKVAQGMQVTGRVNKAAKGTKKTKVFKKGSSPSVMPSQRNMLMLTGKLINYLEYISNAAADG